MPVVSPMKKLPPRKRLLTIALLGIAALIAAPFIAIMMIANARSR